MSLAALFAALDLIAVTNHAGCVLEAYPIALTNKAVILERTSGERLQVPLRAFPESEQHRLCAALGVEEKREPNSKEKRNQQFYQTLLKRNEALYKAGATDEEAYKVRRRRLESLLNK